MGDMNITASNHDAGAASITLTRSAADVARTVKMLRDSGYRTVETTATNKASKPFDFGIAKTVSFQEFALAFIAHQTAGKKRPEGAYTVRRTAKGWSVGVNGGAELAADRDASTAYGMVARCRLMHLASEAEGLRVAYLTGSAA